MNFGYKTTKNVRSIIENQKELNLVRIKTENKNQKELNLVKTKTENKNQKRTKFSENKN
jgi:hypothetical protein